MLRAIAFDAVGTLIYPDPPAWEVYAAVGRRFGSRHPLDVIRSRFLAEFRRQDTYDEQQGWRTSEEREVERWRQIVAAVLDDVANPAACFAALYEHFAGPAAWRCFPGVADLLAELHRRGYRLAIASNFDDRLRAVAAGLPELAAVDTFVISSEVGWRKPAPEYFAALLKTLDLPAEEVLLVGDDFVNDYEGAVRAGIPTRLIDPDGRYPRAGTDRIGGLADLLRPGAVGERPA